MKRWWHLVIAFVVLGGLVAFLEHDFRKEEKTKDAEEKKSLVVPEKFAWDNLQEVEITTDNTAVTFVPTDKKPGGPESWSWAMSKPLATETDSADVQNYLRTLREIKTKSEIDEPSTALSAFGLDPAINKTLKIKLSGKDANLELLVGTLNPDKSSSYAKFADSKKILVIEQKLDYLHVKDLDYFRQHTPILFDNNLVKKVTYNWQGKPSMVLEKQESINGQLTWKMLAPFTARADTLKITSFFGDIKNARVDKFPSEQADKEAAKYGFSKPRGELHIELADEKDPTKGPSKTIKVLIGADNANKSGFYLRRGDLPSVFEMQAFHLEKFNKPINDFIEHNIGNRIDIASVNQIKIGGSAPAAADVKELPNGLWQFAAGGKVYPASREKAQVVVRKLHDLVAKEFVARQPESKHGLNKPQYEIILTSTPKADAATDAAKVKSEAIRFAFNGVKGTPPKGSKLPKQLQPDEIFVQGGVDNFVFKMDPIVYGILKDSLAQLRDQRPIFASMPFTSLRLEIGNKKNNFLVAKNGPNGWEVKERKGEPLTKGYNQESFGELLRALNNLETDFFVNEEDKAASIFSGWQADADNDLHLVLGYAAHPDLDLEIGVKSIASGYRLVAKPSGEFNGYAARLKKGTVDTLLNLLGIAKPQAEKTATPQPPKP